MSEFKIGDRVFVISNKSSWYKLSAKIIGIDLFFGDKIFTLERPNKDRRVVDESTISLVAPKSEVSWDE